MKILGFNRTKNYIRKSKEKCDFSPGVPGGKNPKNSGHPKSLIFTNINYFFNSFKILDKKINSCNYIKYSTNNFELIF